MIIYNVLQPYYDEWCSPESWSLLLTSLLAENNGGAGALKVLRQTIKKHRNSHLFPEAADKTVSGLYAVV